MSNKQIARLVSLALFALLIYYVQGALLPIILSLVLFYALHPLVKQFDRLFGKRVPLAKDLSIALAFVVFIILCVVVVDFIVPPFIEEFTQLTNSLPQFIVRAQHVLSSSQQWYARFHLPVQIDSALADSLNSAFNYTAKFLQTTVLGLVGLLGQFIGFIVIPVIVYYLLKEEGTLVDGIVKLAPNEHKEFFKELLTRINAILKNYVEGQLVICSLIGILTGFGLYLMGIKFFLVLGLIAAITELIPIIGPIIGAVPAVVIALLISPALALGVIIFYLAVQSFGAYYLLPKIMGKKLDLHPLTVLLAVLILGKLIGVWGIFFAAPITAILKVLYLELRKP